MRYRTYDGKVVIYAHLNSVLKKTGDTIKKGEVVALSGNTGQSTGPHLHFGVYNDGKAINPFTLTDESDYK